MKNILDVVLFDMDGTLTEARKEIKAETTNKLKELTRYSHVGVVTGSGMDYLTQQLKDIWAYNSEINPKNITLMPCNGTLVYEWNNNEWEKTFSVSIRDYLGEESFNKLFQILISFINDISTNHAQAFPLTGHFISFRSSLVNFCPVGRNATDSDREKFIKYDKRHNLRENYLKSLKNALIFNGLTNLSVTLGGSTSFDIYPIGWDKTFSLRHFSGKRAWFIGDKCEGSGNDKKIYDKLKPHGRAFKTESPSQTREIIDDIIKKLS